MLLKDQVALITGSGRGIGRAIARMFAREGAAVFLTARTERELFAASEEITRHSGRAAYLAGDLAETSFCERLVAATREKFGRVEILVNNAGHLRPRGSGRAVSSAGIRPRDCRSSARRIPAD